MFSPRFLAAVVFTAAATGAAFAQTPAPAAPATGATAACPKPDPHPGRLASDQKRKGWTKEVNEWQACAKKIIAEVQARADKATAAANAAIAESNAAVADYNETVKDLQAQADAAR